MGRPVSDELLRVGVIGARGRMGAQTCQAVVEPIFVRNLFA